MSGQEKPPRASFTGKVLLGGKTATGIEVPASVVASLGTSKKPAVRVTIAGHTYRSTVAVMDGKFMLPISGENRAAAGVAAGDEVRVDLEVDNQPREIVVPADFAEALDGFPEARRFFDGLSFSVRQWHALSIEEAKTAETRQRRIAKSVATLREGRPR